MTGHCKPLKKEIICIVISSYRIDLRDISYTDLKNEQKRDVQMT